MSDMLDLYFKFLLIVGVVLLLLVFGAGILVGKII